MGAPTEAGSAMKKYTNTLQCVPNLLSKLRVRLGFLKEAAREPAPKSPLRLGASARYNPAQ